MTIEPIKNGGLVKEEVAKINANFSEIGTAAENAQTAAGNAQSTADSAQTAATNAQTAAGNAQTTANEAKTAAANAQTAAGNAQTTADEAKTAAENAQTAADNAQTTANEAKAQAQAAVSTIAIASNAWVASSGEQTFTTAANGKKPLAVMRKNGTTYHAVLVDVAVNGTNIVVTASEAFEGYIVVA